MSFTTISPNMSLTIPVTGQETGPNWANDINNSLLVIDGHTHAAGSGVPITPDGLNINADLSIQLNNLTNVRTVRFNNYPGLGPFAPTVADVGALFEIAAELYYADGVGNLVQMTKLGFVNSGAGSISGLAGFPNASASYIGASGTFVWQQGVNVAANMDSATLILRYPGSYPTPTGNYIAIQAPSSLATGYAFTLPAAPPLASNSLLTSNTVGDISYTSFDQVGQGMTATGANAVANTRTRGIGILNVPVGGVAISNSSGDFSTLSFTPVLVDNFTISLNTSGRPVMIQLIGDTVFPSSSVISAFNNNIQVRCDFQIRRDGITVSQVGLNSGSSIGSSNQSSVAVPPGALSFVDAVGSGLHSYQLWMSVQNIGGSLQGRVSYCRLMAYEL